MISPIALSSNAELLLKKRYLQPNETIDEFWERVSMGRGDYRQMLESLRFLPNSPTLFNLGTGKGTLSACFKFDVPDSMDGILSVSHKAGLVQKYGGGVGYVVSGLRPRGSPVNSTHGFACGPISVIKHYQSLAEMITQGGKRDAAQMAIMHVDHPDIMDFINMKNEDPQRFSTFNISVAVTDAFMEAVAGGHPPEMELFDAIVDSAWRTGDPGLYFIDEAERHNPTPELGRLTGTNPCGEVPLLDNEPCNLGSINLAKFVTPNGWLMDELRETVKLAIEYLDDVLDNNIFPHEDITKAALLTRKLGLGIMGWADALAIQNIPYDSELAIEYADQIMGFIKNVAREKSWELGADGRQAPCFYDYVPQMHSWKNTPNRRNATVTCIAPTGSIALIAGCSSGIEPHYSQYWTRTMGDGTIMHESIGPFPNDFHPKTAMEIGWEWHIKHQAAFQKHTDLAVSKTINMPNSATREDVRRAYLTMWRLGCKGGTVFRDGCRDEQVLVATDNYNGGEGQAIVRSEDFRHSNGGSTPPASTSNRQKLPIDRQALIHKVEIGDFEGYITTGLYEDGRPGELFIQAHKEGSTISGLLDTIGILTSLLLQHGVAIDGIASKLIGSAFEPSGFTRNSSIPKTTSVVDYIFRWMIDRFGTHRGVINGNLCPECGGRVMLQEGCEKCMCGWSRC